MISKLYQINLNLLVALDKLLVERNVTRAGEKLGITQSAMSNNLQQLRNIFKDKLLIREKNYLVPTSYALALAPKLKQLLEEIQGLIAGGQGFIPELSTRNFKIGMSDYLGGILSTRLLESLEKKAPYLKLAITSLNVFEEPNISEQGGYDFMISKLFNSTQPIRKTLLFQSNGVCIMHKNHPLAKKKKLSLEDYLAYQHVGMCADNVDTPRIVDEALAGLKVERSIKIATVFMSVMFSLIQHSTNLLGTVPETIAKLYQSHYDFVIKPLPFTMREIEFYLLWHARYENDMGHRWLREEIVQAFKKE
jgi:DNA-binding transcriptional LysR family regulator